MFSKFYIFFPENLHVVKPYKFFQALQDFKEPRELASHSQIQETVMGFYSLQKWTDSKTFLFSHGLLVSNAQRSGHSGLET